MDQNNAYKVKFTFRKAAERIKYFQWLSAVIVVAIAIFIPPASAEDKSKTKSRICDTPDILSKSFELRVSSDDPNANGETDFKGPTEIFETNDRIEYLRNYAGYARQFFQDENLDKEVVSDAEVRDAVGSLKPQPVPEIRKRISLVNWKYLGSRVGQPDEEQQELETWRLPGVSIENGELLFKEDQVFIEKKITPQSWRFFLQWRVRPGSMPVSFLLSDAVKIDIDGQGQITRRTPDGVESVAACQPGRWIELKVEIDLESKRYNLYVNGSLKADFVPVLSDIPVDIFRIQGSKDLVLDDIWGVGYEKKQFTSDIHTRDEPFGIKTFIDEDFEVIPSTVGWESPSYDDSAWKAVPMWPYAHGGQRYAGEDLYLRTYISAPASERVFLNAECLDPAGEVWINGQVVEVRRDRHPFRIEVTRFIHPRAKNLIAVRVRPFEVERTMRHTAADHHTGWFSGRITLDFTAGQYVTDVFAFTREISNDAKVEVCIDLRNDQWVKSEREVKADDTFKGSLQIVLNSWFPQEHAAVAASLEVPVSLDLGRDVQMTQTLEIPKPNLWTPENPNLYKLTVRLLNVEGKVVDDYVVTTGIRTVSQDGGTFRINGQPAMMNGALIFGFRYPLDKIAQWMKCGPEEWIVREILMLHKMNANTIRMSHHDGPVGSINDPRYAEIGDQLGILFQWGTTAWIRTGNPWQTDFEGLSKYVRLVRNHPSIVMWQPGNHPGFKGFQEGMSWYEKIYNTIAAQDPSRLICPSASNSRLRAPNSDGTIDQKGNPVQPLPIWTAGLLVRGDMDHMTGYGNDWLKLRKWPYPPKWEGEDNWTQSGFRADYLSSKTHAYFDFESEESGSQPNWNLFKGKPWYRIRSYEIPYDEGSIGRELTFDEWQISQAWQAFSGYEAYRKKRWLDYDGLAWCTLDGGGNTATYEKPLTDYYRHAKLAWYTVKMAFQPILAGSKNVDVVYGPQDNIIPMVLNLGSERTVDVLVILYDLNGTQLQKKIYPAVHLIKGRTVTDLEPFRPSVPGQNSFIAVEYVVIAHQSKMN